MRAANHELIVTVARGSSDHAATYLKYAAEIAAGVPVTSVGPSVASIYGRHSGSTALYVEISQSGQSPDIVEMMRSAGAGGALTVAVTNDAASPMATAADHALALQAGAEKSVAATKTFVTSVLAALALVAEWLRTQGCARRWRRFPGSSPRRWSATGRRWPTGWCGRTRPSCWGVAQGFAIANEVALKFKETSAIHARATAQRRCCTGRRRWCRRTSRCWRSGSPTRPCRR